MNNETKNKLQRKKRLEPNMVRKVWSFRMNSFEREKLDKVAEKYLYLNLSEMLRYLAVYDNDILIKEKQIAIRNITRTTNLIKAIYTQAKEDKKALDNLEVIKQELIRIRKDLEQKNDNNFKH